MAEQEVSWMPSIIAGVVTVTGYIGWSVFKRNYEKRLSVWLRQKVLAWLDEEARQPNDEQQDNKDHCGTTPVHCNQARLPQ